MEGKNTRRETHTSIEVLRTTWKELMLIKVEQCQSNVDDVITDLIKFKKEHSAKTSV